MKENKNMEFIQHIHIHSIKMEEKAYIKKDSAVLCVFVVFFYASRAIVWLVHNIFLFFCFLLLYQHFFRVHRKAISTYFCYYIFRLNLNSNQWELRMKKYDISWTHPYSVYVYRNGTFILSFSIVLYRRMNREEKNEKAFN